MTLLIGLIAFVAWLAYVGRELSKQREINDKLLDKASGYINRKKA